MAKMGRPQKDIRQEDFEKLCQLHCTEVEIASYFDVSVDTLERWCKRTYAMTFADKYSRYKDMGKIALRRILMKHAEKSAYMAWKLGRRRHTKGQEDTNGTDEAIEQLIDTLAGRNIDSCTQVQNDNKGDGGNEV